MRTSSAPIFSREYSTRPPCSCAGRMFSGSLCPGADAGEHPFHEEDHHDGERRRDFEHAAVGRLDRRDSERE